jgi:hypothetical protein
MTRRPPMFRLYVYRLADGALVDRIQGHVQDQCRRALAWWPTDGPAARYTITDEPAAPEDAWKPLTKDYPDDPEP